MALDIRIETDNIGIGREFFSSTHEKLASMGFELEQTDPKEKPGAFAILLGEDESRSDHISTSWPDYDFVGLPGERLAIRYLVCGADRPGMGLVVKIDFLGRGATDSLELTVTAETHALWYDEGRRDLLLRVFAFLEYLLGHYPLRRVFCFEYEEGKVWFDIGADDPISWPELVTKESFEGTQELLAEYLAKEGQPFVVDKPTGAVLYRPEGSMTDALLRNNLAGGSMLPEISIDSLYCPIDEAVELQFLSSCWRSAGGIDDLIRDYGPPERFLPAFILPAGICRLSVHHDVTKFACYENLHEDYVVIFREYRCGRTTATLLGKKIEVD